MNAHEERERRRGGGQEGGSTTGQPPSPPRRRQRRTPRRNPAGRFSQSPPTPCSISLPKFGSRAPLAFFLVSVSMAGRDRAAAGPLRPPTGVHCSSAGGGGPVGGPEQPGAGTATEGSRRDVSSSRPSCRSHRRSWRACPLMHALSAAAAPGSITLGESWRPPSSSRRS